MRFRWKNEYATGFSEIDEQHRNFFILFNKLFDIVPKANNEEEILEIISELKSYASYHFKTEEELFIKFNYIEKDKNFHLQEHQDFYTSIKNIENDDSLSIAILGYKLVEFTKNWLVEHILNTDVHFVNYINEKKNNNN
jgi:hemerythrin